LTGKDSLSFTEGLGTFAAETLQTVLDQSRMARLVAGSSAIKVDSGGGLPGIHLSEQWWCKFTWWLPLHTTSLLFLLKKTAKLMRAINPR
jgi:hypothetical protein